MSASASEGKHYLRLSTASEEEVLKEGIRRLKDASEDYEGVRNFLKRRPDIQ